MSVSFQHYFEDYQHYLRFEKRYSPLTLLAYQTDLQLFSNYLQNYYPETTLTEVNHLQLRSWLAELKESEKKERSINRKISSLNGYFKYLLRKGLIHKNPLNMLHSLRLPERLPTFLKESETEILLEQIDFGTDFKGVTDRLIFEIFYISGMRRAELIQLKEQDIEWGLGQIRILGKGNKERLLPISKETKELLEQYIELKLKSEILSKTLFCLPNGKPLYEKYVYLTVKKYLTLVSTIKKKSPHIMRHTFATHLLNKGASIQAIKELLGHSSIAATQVYTHINIDELKKVHKLNHPKG